MDLPQPRNNNVLKIGHAPTRRSAKGSDRILQALHRLRRRHAFEIVLIENLPFEQAMRLKAGCDLFIDQIGELGYGVNSLEALSMGIPTVVELKEDFESFLKPHPFLTVHSATLEVDLERWIMDKQARDKAGVYGIKWVNERHAPDKVSARILQKLFDL